MPYGRLNGEPLRLPLGDVVVRNVDNQNSDLIVGVVVNKYVNVRSEVLVQVCITILETLVGSVVGEGGVRLAIGPLVSVKDVSQSE